MTQDSIVYCTSLAAGIVAAWLFCRLPASAVAALLFACLPVVGAVCLVTLTGDG